jgi:hypothetical protein
MSNVSYCPRLHPLSRIFRREGKQVSHGYRLSPILLSHVNSPLMMWNDNLVRRKTVQIIKQGKRMMMNEIILRRSSGIIDSIRPPKREQVSSYFPVLDCTAS